MYMSKSAAPRSRSARKTTGAGTTKASRTSCCQCELEVLYALNFLFLAALVIHMIWDFLGRFGEGEGEE